MATEIQPKEGLLVLGMLIALILLWLNIDPNGYLVYTCIVVFASVKIVSLLNTKEKRSQKAFAKLAALIVVIVLIIFHLTTSHPVMPFLAVTFILIYASEMKDQSTKLFSKQQ